MADYVTSQRLGYYWLGYDIQKINVHKTKEIGARYRRHSKDKNSLYLKDMIDSLDNIFPKIRKNGFLALLLPEYHQDDARAGIINKICSHCSNNMHLQYNILRNVDELNRWAPFKKLKTERLIIWKK